MGASGIKRVLLLAALALAGCHSTPSQTHNPVDAGTTFVPDAGPPQCTVSCHEVPDAGVDAGYQAQPLTITAVVPHRAPITGGTSVQITGSGFMQTFAGDATQAPAQSTLLVGGNPALDYTVISDGIAEFTAPPGNAGAVDVVLSNPNGTATCPGCFTYYAPVLLQSVAPTNGPLAGGTVVTLVGKGLTADTVVLFGDKTATGVTVDATSGNLTATTPPGESVGSVDVRVFNPVGTSSLLQAFRYTGPPLLTASSPAGGPIAGGTAVNLQGRGLADLTACSIGPNAATLLIQDDAHAQLVAPPGAEGSFDISCTAAAGTTTLKRAYTYFDPTNTSLRLIGIGPTHGPPTGGNVVTLVGGGLASVTTVTFGGQPATIVAEGANLLVVQAPPGPARTDVDVAIDSGATLTAGYHYNLAIADVRPAHGPAHGGTPLQLDGAGLDANVLVTVGGRAITNEAATSAQLLTGRAPQGEGGAALVRASSPTDPEDFCELPGGYTFDVPLGVGAVVPASGSIAGGTFVTVFGDGFAAGTVVSFGGHRAKDITIVDSHTITAHTPAGSVGSVTVSATLSTELASVADGFSYIDTTNAGGGSSGGPLDGTINITVLDDTFTQYGQPVVGAFVILGNDPSTPFQGTTDQHGQITFSDPALIKAQTVSVSKNGYQSVTVVDQASQNLTVFIGQDDGTGGAPGSGSPGPTPVDISGQVHGFKAPHVLQPYEHEECHVAVAPHSVYDAPPLGSPDQPQPGERSVLTADGQTYSRIVYPGLYAVYAIYGIVDERTGVFTPVLMGLARDIEVSDTHPAQHQDIVLDMHLDYSAPVSITNALPIPGLDAPAANDVYPFLDLGGEGVVPLQYSESFTPDLLVTGLPEVDGSNLIFINATNVNGSPASFFFRRQPGDVRSGITLGPMLGLITFTQPTVDNPAFTGTLSWTYGDGPPPDMAQVQIIKLTPVGTVTLWTVVLPGAATTLTLPGSAVQSLLDREPPGEQLEVIVIADRAPRFDYNHWTYGDLGQLSWTSFSYDVVATQLPDAPDGGGP
ncbi:MAG: IPT/TIG domain-containing protein [Deltaproteobacteria bacterium]|nr:IPT/TIG domain-containing protein [Deltaproteobacteria bacterium]